MQITTLLENHTNCDNPSLKAEHGLSFYIENMGHIFMSDVGKSGNFADNAEVLGLTCLRSKPWSSRITIMTMGVG